ncbi:uncharacterized protein N7446_010520 [Penicillium canescens]|uniref:uncharacterized protein n=1 Tax=Penicillium canescens TaxID=5083 RepID=UPI0026DEE4A2|nr:uncharacterized protein N7446_010520 [Penicillium canescens]KAJ6050411.1 hypothetical protein N7446_010520 [Penicillium canescens]KAJ6064715.1 hypothetical protein N7444_000368 [Penicillium canescens]
MFMVDGIAEQSMQGLRSFGLSIGRIMQMVFSMDLIDISAGYPNHYGRFCYSQITKTLIDYICGHAMEQANSKSYTQGNRSSLMPAYLQYKLRRGEPKDPFPEDKYAFSYSEVTPSPIQFINYRTDILSYYKEAFFDLEEGNFVANSAKQRGLSDLEVLQELAAGGVKAMKEIDEIPTDRLIIERVQEFSKGWVMFGTAHRSYGLVRMLEDHDLQPYSEDF